MSTGRLVSLVLTLFVCALAGTTAQAQEVREQVISFGIRPDAFDDAQEPTDEPVGFVQPLDVEYPDIAMRRKLEGITIVAAVVDQGGTVTYAEVRESSGHAVLDSSALNAVINGVYRAARRDGMAVESRVTIPVEFRLDGGGERYQSDKSAEQLSREKEELEKAKRMLEEEERQLQEELRRLKEQKERAEEQAK